MQMNYATEQKAIATVPAKMRELKQKAIQLWTNDIGVSTKFGLALSRSEEIIPMKGVMQ